MKVKERPAVESGGYKCQFKELIRPGNVVGLKDTKGGRRLMFRLSSKDAAADIPGSTKFDFADKQFLSVLGTLAVPANKLKQILDEKGEEKALLAFEKVAQTKKIVLSAYVRETGGFASGIRLWEGTFPIKFDGIVCKVDDATKKVMLPAWQLKAGKQKTNKRTGGTYMTPDIRAFTGRWIVVAGPHKGALLTKEYHYAIAKDDDDEWYVDVETPETERQGREFKQLLVMHKIMPDKLNPDKHFADPENGLPEIEKMILKKPVVVQGKVENGFLNKFEQLPAGVVLASDDVGPEEGNGSAENLSTLYAMLNKRVRKDMSVPAFDEDGNLSKSGRTWVKTNLSKFATNGKIDFNDLDDDGINKIKSHLKKQFPLV